MELKENLNFLVVGAARDAENTLHEDVAIINNSLQNTKSVHWFLVESDSSDGTIATLQKLKKEVPNFNYISLGNLSEKMDKRTERLAFCRNAYVKEIRTNYKNIDYVIIADLDKLNQKLTPKAIDSCFVRDDWDMLSANQNGPYYDLWALRHKYWCPSDCWDSYRFFKKYMTQYGAAMENQIFSKLITIPQNSEWIEVDSAFGGLAIYKRRVFDLSEYIGVTDEGNEVCEHVHFHKILKEKNCKLFINPQLINADYTEMTLAMKSKYRYRRNFKNMILRISPEFLRKRLIRLIERLK